MPACTHPHAITPILLEYTHHFPLDRGSIEGDTNIITLKNSTCYYIRDVPTVALVLRGSVVYIATPDTSAPGSNPGKGAPLIGGRGFARWPKMDGRVVRHRTSGIVPSGGSIARAGQRTLAAPNSFPLLGRNEEVIGEAARNRLLPRQ